MLKHKHVLPLITGAVWMCSCARLFRSRSYAWRACFAFAWHLIFGLLLCTIILVAKAIKYQSMLEINVCLKWWYIYLQLFVFLQMGISLSFWTGWVQARMKNGWPKICKKTHLYERIEIFSLFDLYQTKHFHIHSATSKLSQLQILRSQNEWKLIWDHKYSVDHNTFVEVRDVGRRQVIRISYVNYMAKMIEYEW